MTAMSTPQSQQVDAVTGSHYFPEGRPTQDYIRNCFSRFELRHASGRQPYVVSLPGPDPAPALPAYLTSVSATLFDYPLSAIPWVRRALSREKPSAAQRALHRVASRPKKTLGLFNPPLSNPGLPDNFLEMVDEILPEYRRQYPQAPIMIRGLIQKRHGHTFARLRKLGFHLVFSKRIFIRDNLVSTRHRTQLKKDIKCLQKYRDHISCPTEPLLPAEYEKLAQLYRGVYLDKYSRLSPDYTGDFISHMHREGRLELILYRDEQGVPAGFAGFVGNDKIMSASLIGHDPSIRSHPPIYVLLMAALAEVAIKRQVALNYGGGGHEFKLKRGAVPDFEFIAVKAPRLIGLWTLGRMARAMLGK